MNVATISFHLPRGHTSFPASLLPWASFAPALFLPQWWFFTPRPLPEVQASHPLRMGLLGFWSQPVTMSLISLLRIPGLVPHNMVWPCKPRSRGLDWFSSRRWSILPLVPNSAASRRLKVGRGWGLSVGRDLCEVCLAWPQRLQRHHCFTIPFPFQP